MPLGFHLSVFCVPPKCWHQNVRRHYELRGKNITWLIFYKPGSHSGCYLSGGVPCSQGRVEATENVKRGFLIHNDGLQKSLKFLHAQSNWVFEQGILRTTACNNEELGLAHGVWGSAGVFFSICFFFFSLVICTLKTSKLLMKCT